MDDHFPQYLSNSEADLLITIEREMSDESRAFVEQKKSEAFAEGFAIGFAESIEKTYASAVIRLQKKTDWTLERVIDILDVPEDKKPSLMQKVLDLLSEEKKDSNQK